MNNRHHHDKTRELKHTYIKMVGFLRQSGRLCYDKSDNLCDKSSKLRQMWVREVRLN